MDNKIIQLCNEIDDNGWISVYNLGRRHHRDCQSDIYYTGEWLYLVSHALSFEWWRYDDEFDDDHSFDPELFGRDLKTFKLSYGVAQSLLSTMHHVFYEIWPQITTVTWLEPEIQDFKWSLSNNHDKFERHMHYLCRLTNKLVHETHWHSLLPDGTFIIENEVLMDLKDYIVSTAYDIINDVEYKEDNARYQMDSDQVSVLYLLFGLFRHSISVARLDLIKFERSLRYRSKIDTVTFECLFDYREIHDIILRRYIGYHSHAIDDMLTEVTPSDLARILMNVYPNQHGKTFLHVLANRDKFAFAQLFPHCKEIWGSRDSNGLTPMAALFLIKPYPHDSHIRPPIYTNYGDNFQMIDLLFDIVSHNSNYFASNVLK